MRCGDMTASPTIPSEANSKSKQDRSLATAAAHYTSLPPSHPYISNQRSQTNRINTMVERPISTVPSPFSTSAVFPPSRVPLGRSIHPTNNIFNGRSGAGNSTLAENDIPLVGTTTDKHSNHFVYQDNMRMKPFMTPNKDFISHGQQNQSQTSKVYIPIQSPSHVLNHSRDLYQLDQTDHSVRSPLTQFPPHYRQVDPGSSSFRSQYSIANDFNKNMVELNGFSPIKNGTNINTQLFNSPVQLNSVTKAASDKNVSSLAHVITDERLRGPSLNSLDAFSTNQVGRLNYVDKNAPVENPHSNKTEMFPVAQNAQSTLLPKVPANDQTEGKSGDDSKLDVLHAKDNEPVNQMDNSPTVTSITTEEKNGRDVTSISTIKCVEEKSQDIPTKKCDKDGGGKNEPVNVDKTVEKVTETPLSEEDLKRLKLFNTYAPYLSPGDSSLADARKRLQTSLEQTRMLREEFSNRVYNKYRILLRPVPKTVDDIVAGIMVNPAVAKERIEAKIKMLKEEKDAEKKEIQRRKEELNKECESTMLPMPKPADSEELFGAGLNLVILPEEEIDGDEINIGEYKDRGPTHPETGQRLGGITSAAAAAAEELLQRTRRGAAARVERKRRNALSVTDLKKDTFAGFVSESSSLTATDSAESKKSSRLNEGLMSLPQSIVQGEIKKIKVPKPPVKKAVSDGSTSLSKIKPSQNTSRNSRGSKSKMIMSVNSLLSISPLVEGKTKAAATVIHTLCPKLLTSGGRSSQSSSLRLKYNQHPHPNSKGGKFLSASLKKGTLLNNEENALLLPYLPLENRLKEAPLCQSQIVPQRLISGNHALKTLGDVLNLFYDNSESEKVCTRIIDASDKFGTVKDTEQHDREKSVENYDLCNDEEQMTGNKSLYSKSMTCNDDLISKRKKMSSNKRKRKVTEIGLRLGLRSLQKSTNNNLFNDSGKLKEDSISNEGSEIELIPPSVAFSVLHALGLFGESCALKSKVNNGKQPCECDFDTKSLTPLPDESLKIASLSFSSITLDCWCKGKGEKTPPLSADSPDPTGVCLNSPGKRKRVEVHENCNTDSAIQHSDSTTPSKCTKVEDTRPAAQCNPTIRSDFPNRDTGDDDSHHILSINEKVNESDDFGRGTVSSLPGESNLTNDVMRSGPLHPLSKKNNKDNDFERGAVSSLPDESPVKNNLMRSRPGQFLSKKNLQLSSLHTNWSSLPRREFHEQNNTQFLSLPSSSMQLSHPVVHQASTIHALHSVLPSNIAAHNSISKHVRHPNTYLINGPEQNPMNHSISSHSKSQSTAHYVDSLRPGRASTNSSLDYFQKSNREPPSTIAGGMGSHEWLSLGLATEVVPSQHSGAMIATDIRSLRQNQITGSMRPNICNLTPQQAHTIFGQSGPRIPGLVPYNQQRFPLHGHTNSQSISNRSVIPGMMLTEEQKLKESVLAINAERAKYLKYAGGNTPAIALSSTLRRPASAGPIPTVKQSLQLQRPSSANVVIANRISRIPMKQHNTQQIKTETQKAILSDKNIQPSLTVVQERGGVQSREVNKNANSSPSALSLDESSKRCFHQTFCQDTHKRNAHATENATNPVVNSGTKDRESNSAMRYYAPATPSGISCEDAEMIQSARIHQMKLKENKAVVVEYLVAVSTAIPIPKTLVVNAMKERMLLLFKDTAISPPTIRKDIIAASIIVWLWSEYKGCFQRAFAIRGRIDVDADCKWLVATAVDVSLSSILGDKGLSVKPANFNLSALNTASLICESLMKELNIKENMDLALPNLHHLVEILDRRRVKALKLLCQERVLVASLVSRCMKMSEPFSHAYVSAMVRAGEALGHNELCDIVQDEGTSACTGLPHDILSDASGGWEDPCRPISGFQSGLNANDLIKRAHARAQIHKSLFKLQVKFDIENGVPNIGPYADISAVNSNVVTSGAQLSESAQTPSPRHANGPFFRKKTSSSNSDLIKIPLSSHTTQPIPLFDSQVGSKSCKWNCETVENMPYGRHDSLTKKGKRSLSSNQAHQARLKIARASFRNDVKNEDCFSSFRSTDSIDWADVATQFHPVSVGDQNLVTTSSSKSMSVVESSHIFAPVFKELEITPCQSGVGWSDNDDSDDEDISDAAILSRHQAVLDSMRDKMDHALESNQS